MSISFKTNRPSNYLSRKLVFLVLILLGAVNPLFGQSTPPIQPPNPNPQPLGTPTQIDVDCGAGQSIQEAVDQSGIGTTVRISGECTENVTVSHKSSITFSANPEASVVAHDLDSTVFYVINSTGLKFWGLDLYGLTYIGEDSSADFAGNTIQNETTLWQVGVVVTNSSYAGFGNNVFDGNGYGGIGVTSSSSVSVQQNTFSNNGATAIDILFSSSAAVGNNTFVNHGSAGISVGQNSSLHLNGVNVIENSVIGIACGQSGSMRVDVAQTFVQNTNTDALLLPGCDLLTALPFP